MKTPATTSSAVVETLEGRRHFAAQTLFFENFEGGGAGWSVDTSLGIDTRNPWAVTGAQAGPGFAKSGTRVAATVRPSMDAYFASPAINLPGVNQYNEHLYLKWWQWTDYNSRGGFGASMPTVREWIPSLGGWGPWNVIDPNTEAIPQRTQTWGHVGLDLTQFAGQRVQIGFHHYGNANGAPGWYIDDVSITRETVQRPWQSDTSFENGFNGWTTTRGIWDIGTSNAVRSPTGGRMAGTGLTVAPNSAELSSLVSPAFYLPQNKGQVSLEFKSFMDRSFGSMITVEFQFWMPSVGWSPINNFSADNFDTVLTGYQPAGQWKTFRLPLTNSMSGAHIVPHRILFSAAAGLQNTRGWFIDDVKMFFNGKTPVSPPPVTVARPEVRVFNSFGELTDGVTSVRWGTHKLNSGTKDLVFTIRNAGNANLTLGSIVLEKNTGFAIVKQPLKTIAPGGSTTFTLRMLTTSIGTKSAAVKFTTNDADESVFNFSITGVVAR